MTESQINNSDELSLKVIILEVLNWLRYFKTKWITIIIVCIFCGILGLCYSLFKRINYNAVTTFVLEEDKSSSGMGSLAGLASLAGVDLGANGGGIFQGDNIFELYRSRTMIEKTLFTKILDSGEQKLLVTRYVEFNKLDKKWDKFNNIIDVKFRKLDTIDIRKHRLQDSLLSIIVKEIRDNCLAVSKPDKKLSIISVGVKSKDEVFSKEFNDEIVKNVNDFYKNIKTTKSQLNVRILEEKTDSVRNVMNGAIYSAAAVSDATPNLNLTRQVQRIAPVQRSQFTAETNKAILGELVKNLELSKISLRKETPLIQVLDSPIYPLDNDKIGNLKASAVGLILGFFACIFIFLVKHIYIKTLSEK